MAAIRGDHQRTPSDTPIGAAGRRPATNGDLMSRIRVAIQQPTLAKYRNPVFRELAKQDDIELTLYYGSRSVIRNVEPNGFLGRFIPLMEIKLGRQLFFFHKAQFLAINPKRHDIAILTWNTRYVSLIPALVLARLRGVPTVLWGHAYSKDESRLRLWFRQLVSGLASSLLVYDRTTATRLSSPQNNKTRVFTAPNAIDQSEVEDAKRDITVENLHEFQEQQGIRGHELILFCSRLEPENRLDLLIEALPKIIEETPTAMLVIVGDGQQYRKKLERLVAEHGLGDRVRFLGAIYNEKDLAPWFLSSKLLCYPTNIGLSLLHAFGYGLPVVTSDAVSSQNPEIVALSNGINGYFYRSEDASNLASKVVSLLNDPGKQQEMSRNALRTAQNEYSLESMVSGMKDAIHRTLPASKRNSAK